MISASSRVRVVAAISASSRVVDVDGLVMLISFLVMWGLICAPGRDRGLGEAPQNSGRVFSGFCPYSQYVYTQTPKS